jgi:hypothetical protein
MDCVSQRNSKYTRDHPNTRAVKIVYFIWHRELKVLVVKASSYESQHSFGLSECWLWKECCFLLFLNDVSGFVSILVSHRLHLQLSFCRMSECHYLKPSHKYLLLICGTLSGFKSRFRCCNEALHLIVWAPYQLTFVWQNLVITYFTFLYLFTFLSIYSCLPKLCLLL